MDRRKFFKAAAATSLVVACGRLSTRPKKLLEGELLEPIIRTPVTLRIYDHDKLLATRQEILPTKHDAKAMTSYIGMNSNVVFSDFEGLVTRATLELPALPGHEVPIELGGKYQVLRGDTLTLQANPITGFLSVS